MYHSHQVLENTQMTQSSSSISHLYFSPSTDIFRGCYKGEYGVNPYKIGCHKQGGHGSIYCFCEGDKCNNGPAGH